MTRNGCAYELRISERPTCASGSSSWPTARSEDGESCGNHPGVVDSLTGAAKNWPTPTEDNVNNAGGPSRAREGGFQDLTVAVGLWATPQAHDQRGAKTPEQIAAMREKGAGVRNLNEDAAHWQTPATDSFRSRGGDRKDEMGLDQQARYFPTPASRDYRTPNAKPYSERGGSTKGEQLQNFVAHSLPAPTIPDGPPSLPNAPGLRRRLNPRFVEWLMGFPIGWTEL